MRHEVNLEFPETSVQVKVRGITLAKTTNPILLIENGGFGFTPVYYIPKSDIELTMLLATEETTTCYLKGEAKYWNILVGNKEIKSAGWEYHKPIPGMEALEGCIAFYEKEVEIVIG